MTHKALIRQLEISCLGLDRIDPLCLLVDDVIAALAQPQRKPLTSKEIRAIEVEVAMSNSFAHPTKAEEFARAIEAAHGIREKNNVAQKTNS